MSSEFPEDNPELLELVKKFMVWPCGELGRNAPCMVNCKCSKEFPKQFRQETTITEDPYIYMIIRLLTYFLFGLACHPTLPLMWAQVPFPALHMSLMLGSW